MNQLVVTNVSIYKAIAEDAYAQVADAEKTERTLKPYSSGYILRYDPKQRSFKNSMITVVFTGM
ncbi:hypothetical protein, partial [Methylicorpusculum sp.]